jgi:ribosomal protein L31E
VGGFKMKLETIYNDLVEIMKNEMSFEKAVVLKEKLEKAIREETCYKTTSKTRVSAIKRVASKEKSRPALTGYGICEDYKCVTDSYHAVMIHEDNMPLKLVTTDNELANIVGKENCINGIYPNFKPFIDFDRTTYSKVELDLNDVAQFYKLHKKDKDTLYKIGESYFNINYVKNVVDVLGEDIEVLVSSSDRKPLYIINSKNEMGIVLPIINY